MGMHSLATGALLHGVVSPGRDGSGRVTARDAGSSAPGRRRRPRPQRPQVVLLLLEVCEITIIKASSSVFEIVYYGAIFLELYNENVAAVLKDNGFSKFSETYLTLLVRGLREELDKVLHQLEHLSESP